MDTSAAARLRHLTPLIAADWEFRLRDEPPLTPLGRQATVGCLIEATLAQLAHALGSEADRCAALQVPTLIARVHAHCACGLEPLRRYFDAGEEALRTAAGKALGAELDMVLDVFRVVAQIETDALCADCRRAGGPGCARSV